MTLAAVRTERMRLRIRGQVQGVGFRPHVWRIAARHGVSGFVLNDGEGVLVEAQGVDLKGFRRSLVDEAPPLARIDAIEATTLKLIRGEGAFVIRESGGGAVRTPVAADVAACPACLAEMRDPANRRFGYPFLSCTHCGPRYTATFRLPYDRRSTSFAPFPLCQPCMAEYADPADRRFHAETTACPACGPRLIVRSGPASSLDPLAVVVDAILAGGIVALKGVGGFHLLCDARNEAAVARLRARKKRDGKPFAVMVGSLEAARQLVELDGAGEALVASRARPVVVAPRVAGSGLAAGIADDLPGLGIFLPPSALHDLLFDGLADQDAALVATSANLSGEPLLTDDNEAVVALAGIADVVIGHDRAIAQRCDDSVMRLVDGAPAFIRRARGFAPTPIRLARPVPPVAALGGHLKATVTLTRGDEAFVSQHVGDLDTPGAVAALEESYRHLCSILDVAPRLIAHDRHPDFASTRFAEHLGLPRLSVLHHHAHIAAVVAEHRVDGPVLGLALDGFGLGERGEAWGGELLAVDGLDCRRLGGFLPLAEPGGDRAAREPWRMAAAALHAIGRGEAIKQRFADEPLAVGVAAMLDKGIAGETSSAGRLFDAAAGLLGIARRQVFEGEAAMRLEALVSRPRVLDRGWRIGADGMLDLRPLLAALADGPSVTAGADLFHGTLAAALADWILGASGTMRLSTVALGGGVFLNRVLSEDLAGRLRAAGLRVLTARAVPPNDGGLSLGQAWLAALKADEKGG